MQPKNYILKRINKVILEQNGEFILVCYLVDLN